MQTKTVFALVVQVSDPRFVLTEDHQVIIEENAELPPLVTAKDLNPIDNPFVVMPTQHWNRFQKLIDALDAREKFQKLQCKALILPKDSVLRGQLSDDGSKFIPNIPRRKEIT
jgi:hypothetical protein